MHPDAKDSMEGVRRWWLSSARQATPSGDVEEALAFIVRRGWLEERIVTPDQRVFAVNKDTMKSAAEYLQDHVDAFT